MRYPLHRAGASSPGYVAHATEGRRAGGLVCICANDRCSFIASALRIGVASSARLGDE
jgi:hypothetical protein